LQIDAANEKYADMTLNCENHLPTHAKLNMKSFIRKFVDEKIVASYSSEEAMFDYELKYLPTNRKITAATKLVHNQQNTYDLDAHLKWDADKDESKIVALKSTLAFQSEGREIDSK